MYYSPEGSQNLLNIFVHNFLFYSLEEYLKVSHLSYINTSTLPSIPSQTFSSFCFSQTKDRLIVFKIGFLMSLSEEADVWVIIQTGSLYFLVQPSA